MSVAMQDNISFPHKDFPLTCKPSKTSAAVVSLWHEILELKLVISDSVTMMIDTETVTAEAGEIIFINPYEVHSNLMVEGKSGYYHLFMLDLDFFSAVGIEALDLRSLLLDNRVRFHNLIKNPRTADILEKIAEEITAESPFSQLAVSALLLELFALLLRQEVDTDKQCLSFADRVKFYKAVEPAVVKLRDEYRSHFSGDVLADACSINRHHFCRVFKRAMGMTPVQYQNECRLRIADILLKNGNYSISEIAEQVGFRDEAYFSRTYKKSRGFAPIEAKSKLSK